VSELDEFLQTVVPRQVQADNALLNSDPGPRMELWSHHDPVTVLGARRSASGWAQVSEAFRWIASRFAHGEFHLEVIAAGVSGGLAYTVGYERSRASFDGGPAGPIRLRVTPHLPPRERRVEDRPPPRRPAGDRSSSAGLIYVWTTDCGGRGLVIGSACLCTTFQVPFSRRKMVVTRTATGVSSAAPPTRAR
jgi:hypothetical protein